MTTFNLLLTNACIATMDDSTPFGLIDRGAVGITDGAVAWIGSIDAIPASDPERVLDLGGRLVTPGLVDPHTHIVYGEEGFGDFDVLTNGGQRWDLEAAGAGVGGLVRRTRALTEDELYDASKARMTRLIANGVTTVESKSGAGLDRDTELRALKVSRALGRDLPVTVVTTYLGAHGLAPEYTDRRDDYVSFMCDEVLPAAIAGNLVDQVDGFCDEVGYSHAQMGHLYAIAAAHGLGVKAHADQYSDFGAGAMVASHGGLSADHLEFASEATVRAMAESGTIATLLPGANLTLHETKRPPVDLFRTHGVPMALATNCNPVSSPSVSPSAQMHLACYLFGLTAEEAVKGFTVNAARALGRANEDGQIAVGRAADLAIWDTDDPRGLAYQIGGTVCLGVVKNGRLVHETRDLTT